MSRQNTFTVIPKADQPAADSPMRPMTSKQVRKAYKASTKTPPMSRAERYKWEKAEQERIRKEFEKEKASAKARAARERKKEKEMAVLEEKKRSGMPLVSVRPSQDTIARFVRGNGSGKKRDADRDSPATKRVTMAMPDIAEADEADEADEHAEETKNDVFDIILEEDELDGDILEELDNLVEAPPDANATTPVDEPEPHDADTMSGEETDTHIQHTTPMISTEELMEEIPEEVQETARDNIPETTNERWQEEAEESAEQRVRGDAQESQDTIEDTTEEEPKDALRNQDQAQTEDPPIIPNKPAGEFIKPPLPVPVPAATRHPSPPPRYAAPPMSTQAIFTNIDEFFPTSSQHQRELDEDEETEFGSFPSPSETDPLELEKAVEFTEAPAKGTISQEFPDLGSSFLLDDALAMEPDPEGTAQRETAPQSPKEPLQNTNIEQQQQPQHKTPRTVTAPEPEPAPALTPIPAATPTLPPPPARFFTSSGSREQLSLALQRSRRTAALEEMREKERQRCEAGAAMRRSKLENRQVQANPPQRALAPSNPAKPLVPAAAENKENKHPSLDADVYNDLFGSQETDYGGDWVEEMALDLTM